MPDPDLVLHYWFDVLAPEDWFSGGEEIDLEISKRFRAAWEQAAGGGCSNWCGTSDGSQALTILLDQFPRNMFRGSAKSFWSDALARETANWAIAKGQDIEIPELGRQFFYLPFMHSEDLSIQDLSVGLYRERLPETGAESLIHARAHREIIKQFGRFPYRNDALNRETTEAEASWIAEGGYQKMVEVMRHSP